MRGDAAFDAVVVGAGFGGLYALHRLSGLGLDAVCLEAGDGVGGTWYWNRYPGARVDIESMQYSYSFDEELQQDWTWPEHFSPQPDLEAYANHVADRFGLRERIRFGTRVNRLGFDAQTSRWHLAAEDGFAATAKYVIAATGSLHAHNVPDVPGLGSFGGTWHHTSRWPAEGVDLTGKRVGLIGTGSTGIQIAPVAAESAEHLTVFQRTPAFSVPAVHRALDAAYEQEWKARYAERRATMRANPSAVFPTVPRFGSVFDHSPEARQEILERAWSARNGLLFLQAFTDTMVDPAANEVVAEFIRGKIRRIVRDPDVAELLCPKTYPVGTKRICMDTGYYETFNRDNVTLVDVRTHPITRITESGLQTTNAAYDLDVIVFATGFDGVTGSFTAMNVTGLNGLDLREKWADGPTSYLGLLVAGFPNLFMVHGPGSPGVLAQMITGGEWQVDWITRFIDHMEAEGHQRVDTTTEWERRWGAEVDGAADHTLYKRADSWYMGANIPGKPRVFMIYVGGFDRYVRRCTEQVDAGYEGFVFDGTARTAP
ncbi:NAD(P)/FAD-dependent oxidoreductase [Streptomyces sp. WMMC500]|uniref:flavin-containing monooxygenase n=1 Tax=Streptomyces sp. WMMC500 TaxID=3015154 RepID=UPI00248AD216|nr:NAD(P)/FAD-dependent oxidoreductase [Streptomyces sp. WMMC500]WBB61261.1 NAD(P)/FAD-dependent oxidoreductase [Streptomyces sp. WMMC500]